MDLTQFVEKINGKKIDWIELWSGETQISMLYVGKPVAIVLEGEHARFEFSAESKEVTGSDDKVHTYEVRLGEDYTVSADGGVYSLVIGGIRHNFLVQQGKTIAELGEMTISQLGNTKISDL